MKDIDYVRGALTHWFPVGGEFAHTHLQQFAKLIRIRSCTRTWQLSALSNILRSIRLQARTHAHMRTLVSASETHIYVMNNVWSCARYNARAPTCAARVQHVDWLSKCERRVHFISLTPSAPSAPTWTTATTTTTAPETTAISSSTQAAAAVPLCRAYARTHASASERSWCTPNAAAALQPAAAALQHRGAPIRKSSPSV